MDTPSCLFRCTLCFSRPDLCIFCFFFFFFQAEDGIRDVAVTGVQTCALPISVLRDTLTPLPVLAGRIGAPFHRALLRHATGPFQEELDPFATAQPTDRSTIFRHCLSP